MNDYIKYDHTINEKDLLETIREVKEHGYNVFVIINGEYYDIKLNDEKRGPKNEK